MTYEAIGAFAALGTLVVIIATANRHPRGNYPASAPRME